MAGRLVLLTVAAFVALAPLCSAVIAAPQASGLAVLHGDHAVGPAQHDATVATFTAAIGGDYQGGNCTLYSCCTVALVNTARLEHTAGTAVLTVVAETAAQSQDCCRLSDMTGPAVAPPVTIEHAPLRL